jgi:N-acetylmuramoyl-L-alanine amidase
LSDRNAADTLCATALVAPFNAYKVSNGIFLSKMPFDKDCSERSAFVTAFAIMKKILFVTLIAFFLAGCATVPPKENLPAYNLNGTTYYALIPLCEARGISWQYDTFTRSVTLRKNAHSVNLMAGQNLVLVDGSPQHLQHAVDIYQGTPVIPARFKEQVLDVLFRAPVQDRAKVSFEKIKKVVIDAGHGGTDPGAIGRSGLREKDVNLDIAKRLSALLRSQGIDVVMTRSRDNFVALSQRVDIANDSGAELFISIHSNANRVKSLNGFEVYYVSPSVSDSKRASTSAREEDLDLDDATFAGRSADLKAIVWDMIYTNSRAESIEMARAVCRSMDDNLDAKFLRIKAARFQVLGGVRMPAVLIEVGFLSNAQEERMLRNGYYRQKIAESIGQGLRDYSRNSQLVEMAHR